MRFAKELAGVALCLVFASASAQNAAPNSSCPIVASASPASYSRPHQVPTTAARDDTTHHVVTPGGMVLDTPKMVAATDVLTVVARDPNVLCFHLLTFSRERHRCELTGVARKGSEGAYLFREDTAAVRFTFIGDEQVNVEPVGDDYRKRCEPSGKIEPATYTLSTQLGR